MSHMSAAERAAMGARLERRARGFVTEPPDDQPEFVRILGGKGNAVKLAGAIYHPRCYTELYEASIITEEQDKKSVTGDAAQWCACSLCGERFGEEG